MPNRILDWLADDRFHFTRIFCMCNSACFIGKVRPLPTVSKKYTLVEKAGSRKRKEKPTKLSQQLLKMEPDPRDEELGMKSLPCSCKDAWGKQIPPEPPPFNMISWIGERSHESEITMVEQEPKGGENVNDPSTIVDNPSSIETPISSEQEHPLILLEPDPIREFGIFGHFVLRWICCWTIEPQGSREVDQVLWKWPSWKWPVKMPFQGTRDASDIMVKHVPQEPSSTRTKTSGKPSHHQSEITMEPELEGGQSGGPLIVDQPNFIEMRTSLAQEQRLTSLEPDQIQEKLASLPLPQPCEFMPKNSHDMNNSEALDGCDVILKGEHTCYNDLQEIERTVFLDIACYFSGLKETTAIRIWDFQSHLIGLQSLKDKSIVEVSKNGEISMHQQLEDMGQKIAKTIERNRLWGSTKEDLQILQEEKVAQRLEGMSLKGYEELPSSVFENIKLPNLRLLDMIEVSKNILEGFIHQQHLHYLRWLRFQNSKIEELPNNLVHCFHLRVLNLAKCFKLKELPISIGQLITLQELNLSMCSDLKKLPTSIDQLTALQKIDMSGCSKLLELPTTIGQLIALNEFDLSKCSKLKGLPTSVAKLINLHEFDLSLCSKLKELPISISQLIGLKHLKLSNCWELKILPTFTSQMIAFQQLDLSNCSELEELPTSIEQLITLQEFDLSGCSGLKQLPTSIGQLIALRKLDLSECSELQKLPTSIGQLITLQKFDLSGCSKLKELPTSIGQLIALRKLDISRCFELKNLPTSIGQLIALQEFDMSGCSTLKELPPSIGQLIGLQKFNLSSCSNLKEIPTSINQLIALQEFDLSRCFQLQETLTSIGHLTNLQELDLSGCSKLKELPTSIGQLIMLQKFDLSGCSNLKKLPTSIGQLVALQEFDVSKCFELQGLFMSIDQLTNLQILDLSECFKLKELPSTIGKLIVLQKLNLSKCCELIELQTSIDHLINLQELDLSECSKLKTLPSSIGQLINLQKLDLSNCSNLEEIPESICQLIKLQEFDLSKCFKVKNLPTSIGKLLVLQELDLSGCLKLEELPSSIGKLITLQKLDLSGCSKLKELPTSIGQLVALQKFEFYGCSRLTELPISIGQLIILQKLDLLGCIELVKLPTSIGQLVALQKFDLSGCSNLKELPTSIGQLIVLQEFDLFRCSELRELPISIGQMVMLRKLDLSRCYELKELPTSIGQLIALKEFYLLGCSKLRELPTSIGQLINLQHLDLSMCSKLKELPTSIGQLDNLRELNLSNCNQLKELPTSLGQLIALEQLDLSRCHELRKLPRSINQLITLDRFGLVDCSKLKVLPTSIGRLKKALEKFNSLAQLDSVSTMDPSPMKVEIPHQFQISMEKKLEERHNNIDPSTFDKPIPIETFLIAPQKHKPTPLNLYSIIPKGSKPSCDFIAIFKHYLEVTMELKNRVQSNELQCCYLLYKLTKVMDDAHKDIHNLTPQRIQTLEKILKNLWQVAKDIEKLVNYCCNDQWIQKVVMWGNTIEHFVLLAFELELYKTLLQKSIYGQAKKFLCELGTWSNNAKIEEINIITAMAIHDRQKNLSSLEAQIMSNDHNDDEKVFLAKYLIKRLCIDSNEVNVMDACKVKYDSLKRLKPLYKTSVSNVHKISWLGQKFAEKCYNGPIEQSFQQEASLLARFSHPNIVPFVCYATDDKSCSLIMELMNGDLQSLMHENMHKDKTLDAPFGLLEAMDIMLQIAEGMRYLHQNKVVHRDLKSMNVLIIKYDEYVCAKVADFGLSKTRSSICTYSNLTENVGTTRWMAPELHEHQSPTISSSIESNKILKYPFKVDVYSFGMVCYEILTGHLPFYEITMMMELRQQIKDGLRPKIPKQYPTSLTTLLENCFHSNPEIRPSFDEICMQLRHIKCSLIVE